MDKKSDGIGFVENLKIDLKKIQLIKQISSHRK